MKLMIFVKKIVSIFPEDIKLILRDVYNFVHPVFYIGSDRFCPVCKKNSRKFLNFGLIPREDAACVHCGALERHRFIWLFFCKKTNLFDGIGKRMLHIAPEKCFEDKLKESIGNGYITADLLKSKAMVEMDIMNIQYPNESFDVIYCSHVLEHVQNDKKAIKEIFRVLKQDGWAILLVPISVDKTFEDSKIVDPRERRKIFGQEDHVRCYGPDFIERLQEAGFIVQVNYVSDLFNKDEILLMGLTPASGEIFYCTKN